ncbi:MAG: heme-binding protein [Burkholderiales bacterium]|nr:heme-binding protein [Burkholderiales bacterium]
MNKISKYAVALICVAGSTGAMAQGVVNRPQLSAALANELVGDTVAICAKQGHKVWAVVVNLDGVRQALLRGDGAPIHSQDNGYYKAYSAASYTLGRNENSTKEVADRLAKAAPSTVPPTILPNTSLGQGGLVIRMAGGQVIGAIGVSGAPGGQLDEACAREALAKIQDRIK